MVVSKLGESDRESPRRSAGRAMQAVGTANVAAPAGVLPECLRNSREAVCWGEASSCGQ